MKMSAVGLRESSRFCFSSVSVHYRGGTRIQRIERICADQKKRNGKAEYFWGQNASHELSAVTFHLSGDACRPSKSFFRKVVLPNPFLIREHPLDPHCNRSKFLHGAQNSSPRPVRANR
jgi:hypothetical protein